MIHLLVLISVTDKPQKLSPEQLNSALFYLHGINNEITILASQRLGKEKGNIIMKIIGGQKLQKKKARHLRKYKIRTLSTWRGKESSYKEMMFKKT